MTAEAPILQCIINDPLELNLSYMPFIEGGGLFVPTSEYFALGAEVLIHLQLPGKKDSVKIQGRVVWITPANALHHVLPGVGVQFVGQEAPTTKTLIESHLDPKMEVGGYTYGITESGTKHS